jgi:hypothetical protein
LQGGVTMAEENIITWNPTNMLSIGLMAALFFALLGLGQSLYARRKAS